MGRHHEHRKRVTGRVAAVGGAVTVVAAALTVFAPSASADTVSVGYGSCTSSNSALSAPPPNYTSQVTLKTQSSSFQVGKPITLTWHYSISTAPGPAGIPIANVATAKAKIVVGGAASSTITAGPSATFPSAVVLPGKTFQIPDMTATFTAKAPGTYTFTPGDNEQDIAVPALVVGCTAAAAGSALSITVTPATGGDTASSSSSPSTTSAASSSSAASDSSSTSSTGVLPHTGFDGRWLAGAVVLAAALGGTSLYATRRRRGSHG
ncbi:hypothetical protein [Catenulispora rubra]|uniref:hypothetical protein n=1 Tax=Catenulispora rubra TaxID=280293 RepID=UPI0018926192|nr:hypothetical protein [Catenulispora rubra]